MLAVVFELLNLRVESVFLKLEFLGLLSQDLSLYFVFEAIHSLLEQRQQSTAAV